VTCPKAFARAAMRIENAKRVRPCPCTDRDVARRIDKNFSQLNRVILEDGGNSIIAAANGAAAA